MPPRTPIRPGSALAAELWEKGRSSSCPVYNMHGHMGPYHGIAFPRAEAAQMVRSMDAAGVKLLCFAHHAAALAPELGNRPAVEAVRAFPDRLRAWLWINPNFPEVADKELAEFDSMRDVYVGLKVHGTWHGVAVTDRRYEKALAFADERGGLVLMHTYGDSPLNDASAVRTVLARYPNARFLLAHCFKPRWQDAIEVALEFPNAWLELTGCLGQWGAVDVMCEAVGSERMLFGTDQPWYGNHQGIGQLLSADITDEDIHNICHRNAERLLGV